jgi:hypothetical protein
LADVIAQLSQSLQDDPPNDPTVLAEFGILETLVAILDSPPSGLRTSAISCLVNISSLDRGFPDFFHGPDFLARIASVFHGGCIDSRDAILLTTLLCNLLHDGDPTVHAFCRSHLPISFLAQGRDSDVVSVVLNYAKQMAKLPLADDASAVLHFIASQRPARCDDDIRSSLWTLINLVHSKSLDFELFEELGFLEMLQSVLLDPTETLIALGCKLLILLFASFSFTYTFHIARLLDVLKDPKDEENAAACAVALAAIFANQDEFVHQQIAANIVGSLISIFESRGIKAKVALVGVFHGIVRCADEVEFSTVLGDATQKIFETCSDLLQTQNEDVLQTCLRLFVLMFEKSECFRVIECCKELFYRAFTMEMMAELEFTDPETEILIERLCEY